MKQSAPFTVPAFQPELQLILELLSEDYVSSASTASLEDRSFAGIDWDLFLEYVRHHRLQPWLYVKLKSKHASWVPSRVLQVLQHEYMRNTVRMLQLSGEMRRLQDEFAARSIRVIMLKGPVLGAMLYGDMSLRISKDLDILVSMDDLERAEQAMRELGYELDYEVPRIFNDWKWKAHHLTYMNAHTGIQVELHWRMNRDCGEEPDFEELWSRRRIFADSIAYLSEHDMFLQLIQHGARHGWFRLRWLLDIDRMLLTLTRTDELVAFIRQHDSLHLAGQALVLVHHLFNTPIPEPFRPLLADRWSLRIAASSLMFISEKVRPDKTSNQEITKRFNSYLFSIMSLRTMIKFVAVRLYPNSWDSRIFKLPRRLSFLYVPLRPFLWLWRRVIHTYHLAAKEEERLDAGTH
jgi:hypothetical protein